MSTAQRIVRRVRSRITWLVLLALSGVALAGALASIDMGLSDRPLLAIAALVAAAVAAFVVWKLHSVALDLRELRRRPAPSLPQTPLSSTPPPAPVPAAPTERTLEEKLRDIGVFNPQRASGTTAGRQAAAVTVDPDAPFRLYAATHQAHSAGGGGRTFAVAGSDRLVRLLERSGTVHRLHPSMSMAEMAKADPDVLVVEEDAFEQGSWNGTLEPHGGQLLKELRVAMSTMRRHRRPIYVLTATGVSGQAAPFLRADTIVVDDTVIEGDTPPSLLRTLALHRQSVSENAS